MVLENITTEIKERMMRERLICIAALTVFIMFVAAPSFAKGLLGYQYFNVTWGQTIPGDDDLKDLEDSNLTALLFFNYPVNQHVDANVSYGGSFFEGDIGQTKFEVDIQTVLGGISYHFSPNRKVDPFVDVKVGSAMTEVKATVSGYSEPGESEKEHDFAFSVGGGIEVDISDQAAIRPTLVYNNFGDEDDVVAGLSLNIWFTKSFLAGLSTSYAFDDGDFFYALVFGFGF